jgi:SAM-dependent methyltransferase
MDQVASHVGAHQPRVILDLGCGTGRYAPALDTSPRHRYGRRPVGEDAPPSTSEVPNRSLTIRAWLRRIRPVSDASVDVVFISIAFHHFRDPRRVARECRRVLADGGPVLVRTGTRDPYRQLPVRPCCPQNVPLMEGRLPTAAFVEETFHAAGFRTDMFQVIVQTIAPSLAVYAAKLAKGGDSMLASLSSDGFNAGLAALRVHAAYLASSQRSPASESSGTLPGCRDLLGALPERRDYNRIAERQTTDVERLLPNSPTF